MPRNFESAARRQYYGGAPNAWAGGAMFQQDQRRRQHQENALNALIQRFGPKAGDPTAWGQVQAIDQRGQMFPHQIAEMEHRAQVRPHEIAGLEHQERLRPHQLGAAERTTAAFNALGDQYGAIHADPTASRIHEGQQEILRSAAQNAARSIQHAMQNDGDVLAAFDRAVRVLPALGFPAEKIAEMRGVIAENPEAAGELVAMLLGRDDQSGRPLGQGQAFFNPETGEYEWRIFGPDGQAFNPVPGLIPAGADQAQQRIGQRDRALTNEEARMRGFDATPGHQFYETPEGEIYARVIGGTAQEREVQAEEREVASNARAMVRVNSGIVAAGRTVQRDGRRALARLGADLTPQPGEDLPREMGRLPRNVPLWRMLSSKVWGTQARRLALNIQSVMDNIGIDKLLEIKASGAGLGHVPQRQLETLMSVLGRMKDLDRPIPELLRDMEDVLARYDEIIRLAEQEISEAETMLGRSQEFSPQGASQTGGGWQQRAQELQAQGLSQQEILDTLRREGLIR